MNTLLIHADSISFQAKKATKFAEKVSAKQKKGKALNALVCFAAFEESDDSNPKAVAENWSKEIEKVVEQVKAEKIVLYPYVHLLFGKKPSRTSSALDILKEAEKILSKKFKVLRAPFGFYKEFSIKAKGHPLAELSRIVSGKEEGESKALKAERKLSSSWNILDLNGSLHEISLKNGKIEGFDFSNYPKLEKFCLYEMAKSREVREEPPHVKLMKTLGIANYEPGSDPGNLRYPPKGKMIKALVEQYTTQKMLEYGALEMESPIMYDFEHPALKSYLERFPARQYTIETLNKRVFLRFSACFGQFLMLHDAGISYKQLPVKLYELTKYSFRQEQSGELTGLRRLRAFTMPDCHALVKDIEQAKEEFLKRYALAMEIQKTIGFNIPQDFELAVRAVKSFWNENQEFVKNLVKDYGKPALIELWDSQEFYFILKYEWNFVDNIGKAVALNTDQIDVENAKRFGITFTDKDNTKKNPLILHFSPTGATERTLYALLERAFEEQKQGKNPILPLWLSPTQVRLLPVTDSFLSFADSLSKELEEKNIRVDIDDRNETISKKIRDSEMEWIPFTVVLGEKEKSGEELTVRVREKNSQEKISKEKLIELVSSKTKNLPFRPVPLPKYVSKRPLFA